jgi:hypothetical protein
LIKISRATNAGYRGDEQYVRRGTSGCVWRGQAALGQRRPPAHQTYAQDSVQTRRAEPACLHKIHQLRLSIIDDAAGVPTLTQPLPAAIRGRGLFIVEALSRRWGVDRSAAGKEAWAEFALS